MMLEKKHINTILLIGHPSTGKTNLAEQAKLILAKAEAAGHRVIVMTKEMSEADIAKRVEVVGVGTFLEELDKQLKLEREKRIFRIERHPELEPIFYPIPKKSKHKTNNAFKHLQQKHNFRKR